MRTKNSILNSFFSGLVVVIQVFIGFISTKIFLNILNAEYLGINGLFSNIISVLSIAELGFGEAIIFNMYKPIAKNDYETIKSLLDVYKKIYNLIAIFITVIGLILIPFLPFFVGETTLNINITYVYLLFLFQTVSTYLLTYKRSILYANQKNYIISIVHLICIILLNIFQLLILYISKNYYLYLFIKIIFNFFENIFISILANKFYNFIKEKNIKKINKNIKDDILNRVGATFFHKIGGVIVSSTDNIIISKFLGVLTVGLYSNYFLIFSSVKNFVTQVINALTPSIGNLLLERNYEKNFDIYKKIRFINFIFAINAEIFTLLLIQPFVTLWLGENYLLDIFVVSVLCINFYQKIMRSCNDVFLSAAGICVETKYIPLIESFLNILFSIIFLKIFGLAGVFIGTIISGLTLWCYSYPKFVYKKLFCKSYLNYYKETISYLFLFLILSLVTYNISAIFIFNNIYLELLFNFALALFFPNFILYFLFYRSDNFSYFINLLNIRKKNNS